MKIFSFILLIALSLPTLEAKIKVMTTTPDLAWLANQIGKEHVEVESLLSGSEDPHYVDVVPSFISKVMKADIVCSVGLDLEVGWLPRVLARSARSHLQPGGSGVCVVSDSVEALDKIEGKVDRSLGHVHAAGNPHFTLGPSFMAQAARTVYENLVKIKPLEKEAFEKNFQALEVSLSELKNELTSKLNPVSTNFFLMEYHKDFSYFFYDYKLLSFGAIEEVPGVPPSAGRIAERASEAREKGIKLVLASHVSPMKVLTRFHSIAGTKSIQVPTMMTTDGPFSDYFYLQRWLVDEIVKHAK